MNLQFACDESPCILAHLLSNMEDDLFMDSLELNARQGRLKTAEQCE